MRRSLVIVLVLSALVAAAAGAYAAADDAPTLTAPQATAISARAAELSAIADTDEIGGTLTVSYGHSAVTPLTSVTLVKIPRGAKLGRAGGVVMDLEPGTTYHYRLTLTTIDGSATTPDATFTTAGRAARTHCRVPALKGQTLPVARRALTRAGCRTGRVRRPAHAGGHARLVVAAQSVPAGRVRATGTKVALRLRTAPRR
jgi:hypothetical protein